MFILARLTPVRQLLWRLLPAAKPVSQTVTSAVFGRVPISELVTELRATGLTQGIALPESICRGIREFAGQHDCFGNFDRSLAFQASQHVEAQRAFRRAILTGQYLNRIKDCPDIQQLCKDPVLQAISAAYLGSRSRVISTRLWWSFPTETVNDAELSLASQDRLHFDLDDWRTLKFFFYITDVNQDAGPFAYVKGSHRRHDRRHQWTMLCGHPNEEVLAIYGAQNLFQVIGGPGSGIIVDPFGFHMGIRPKSSPRLMLEIGFGISQALRRRFYGEAMPHRS